mmetsp:Transcript_24778/g.57414  ORF Transcript_24778/g.57414 Transcript_24778/m.57414 type:complete len:219 (+) Transcript_24778:1092-1748(+)
MILCRPVVRNRVVALQHLHLLNRAVRFQGVYPLLHRHPAAPRALLEEPHLRLGAALSMVAEVVVVAPRHYDRCGCHGEGSIVFEIAVLRVSDDKQPRHLNRHRTVDILCRSQLPVLGAGVGPGHAVLYGVRVCELVGLCLVVNNVGALHPPDLRQPEPDPAGRLGLQTEHDLLSHHAPAQEDARSHLLGVVVLHAQARSRRCRPEAEEGEEESCVEGT